VTGRALLQGSLRAWLGTTTGSTSMSDDCLVTDAASGMPMSARPHHPRNREDLAARHRWLTSAGRRYSYGMLGRTLRLLQ